MSLASMTMTEVIKKQYIYKLQAYIQVFFSLLFLQLIAVLFSLSGVATMGTSGGMVDMEIRYYSADLVVVFTMLWGFISAVLITTRAYRNDDFLFVTNRFTSNLSNMLFLLTASLIGAITAILSFYLLSIVVNLFGSDYFINNTPVLKDPVEVLLGMFSAFLYILLFCMLGYLAGTLVQVHKSFVVLLPAAFLGSLFLDLADGRAGVFAEVFKFYHSEHSILLFTVKVMVTAGVLFLVSAGLSNRLEVRS
ncbi:hypothetical protein [Neobacillus dielmonensis]|uniref:hypothetical protein n=1 Tax=Neobacillus dielmonensis TaxID=1347369 RepID=UPI0005A87597|nr:hypothetical protein [Neobacillus dielmonensis]